MCFRIQKFPHQTAVCLEYRKQEKLKFMCALKVIIHFFVGYIFIKENYGEYDKDERYNI